jgi:hypothetical protein
MQHVRCIRIASRGELGNRVRDDWQRRLDRDLSLRAGYRPRLARLAGRSVPAARRAFAELDAKKLVRFAKDILQIARRQRSAKNLLDLRRELGAQLVERREPCGNGPWRVDRTTKNAA